jgi:hypothetical protein
MRRSCRKADRVIGQSDGSFAASLTSRSMAFFFNAVAARAMSTSPMRSTCGTRRSSAAISWRKWRCARTRSLSTAGFLLAIESSESAGIAAASTPSSGWLPAVRSTRIEGRHVDHLLAFLTSRLRGSGGLVSSSRSVSSARCWGRGSRRMRSRSLGRIRPSRRASVRAPIACSSRSRTNAAGFRTETVGHCSGCSRSEARIEPARGLASPSAAGR